MERRAAQGGGVFGGVAGAGAAAAFAEDDVEHPVELIFHAPMAAYGARETGSVQTQTGEGVAAFEAAVPVEFAHGFHAANALKALPFVAVGKTSRCRRSASGGAFRVGRGPFPPTLSGRGWRRQRR